ncbi:hypothetical protein SAMN04488023_12068 [Pedobacter rhizosphaerae]|uniref:Lipoprotein n=1 Tax=Pedobacter rhizosphaerae TaxID=390241 RepID=A0A1H9T348_9SPHI|nr:hypothetical protein SAMN04488023_12068 [Pedobacter rhizosphaerae]
MKGEKAGTMKLILLWIGGMFGCGSVSLLISWAAACEKQY